MCMMIREYSEEDRQAWESADDDEAEPEVEIPMDVPEGGGVLLVTLHEGKDLEGKHHCNPYVVLRLRDKTFQSKVRRAGTLFVGFMVSESVGMKGTGLSWNPCLWESPFNGVH